MIRFRKKEESTPEKMKDVLRELKKIKEESKLLKEELKKIKEEQKLCLQKVKMTRFNPFSKEGGNQSFTVAMLNKNNDGLVITSLYTKEGNRMYGKPIEEGASQFSLSKEEENTLKELMGEK